MVFQIAELMFGWLIRPSKRIPGYVWTGGYVWPITLVWSLVKRIFKGLNLTQDEACPPLLEKVWGISAGQSAKITPHSLCYQAITLIPLMHTCSAGKTLQDLIALSAMYDGEPNIEGSCHNIQGINFKLWRDKQGTSVFICDHHSQPPETLRIIVKIINFCFIFSGNFFQSEVNKRETIAVTEANK